MSGPMRGSCQCGAVTFRIEGRFERFFLCHCSRCRKDTGSNHAANLFSATGRVEWLTGHDRVRSYRVPGTRHERAFCAACGAALPREGSGGGPLVVPAGCLDTDVGLRPTAHICCASRADWDDHLEDLPHLDGLPG
ncbi:MAG: GFA family protein [Alsobacter sp.]